MQQAVIGLYTDLKIANLAQLQFCGSAENYSYVREIDSSEALYIIDPADHTPEEFMSLQQFNDMLAKVDEKEVKRFPSIHWVDANSFYFHKSVAVSLLNLRLL